MGGAWGGATGRGAGGGGRGEGVGTGVMELVAEEEGAEEMEEGGGGALAVGWAAVVCRKWWHTTERFSFIHQTLMTLYNRFQHAIIIQRALGLVDQAGAVKTS